MKGTDRLESALQCIPADSRETWLRMGMAVKSELGDDGFGLWSEWSQAAPNYEERAARDAWKSFKESGRINVGTLFYEARRHGWQDDQPQEKTLHEASIPRQQPARPDGKDRQRADSAAGLAHTVYAAATALQPDHPYLVRKGVKPTSTLRELDAGKLAGLIGYPPKSSGEPLTGRILIAPVKMGNAVSTLEFIDQDGRKCALAGGVKSSGYWATSPLDGKHIPIAEGVATALTVAEAIGSPAVAALSDTNLGKVATTLRGQYPDAEIVICADVDKVTGKADRYAIAAAQAVGAKLAVPDFGAQRRPGQTDFNDLAQTHGIDVTRQCIVRAAQVQADGHPWPDPVEIKSELPSAPDFDAQTLLPPPLADFVTDEADRMNCAPDFIAATLLVALGAVIGTAVALKPKRHDDWIVTANLYGGVVGEPSAKKSPAIGTVMRFVDRQEAREAAAQAERVNAYEAEVAACEAQEAAIKGAMKKAAGGKKPDSTAMSVAINDLQNLERPEEPFGRRFKTNDATVEKISDILAHSPHGLLVLRDELMGLLAGWEREGHEQDRAFYLEGWNGTSPFLVDRVSRGSQRIETLCLSVFGGIQPDLLQRYLTRIADSMDNDGRIQRFQVLVYPERPDWQWVDRYPVQGAREAVRDVFDRLASIDPAAVGADPASDFVKLPYLTFDDEAMAIFVQWTREVNTESLPNEPSPLMRQHLGKMEKLFCSVALILHLAQDKVGTVDGDDAVRAAVWCQYLMGHARRIYALTETARTDAAQVLTRRLGKFEDGFTARDVLRKGWGGLRTAPDVETALNLLEESGWVMSQEDRDDRGGRPTIRYAVNPKVRAGK